MLAASHLPSRSRRVGLRSVCSSPCGKRPVRESARILNSSHRRIMTLYGWQGPSGSSLRNKAPTCLVDNHLLAPPGYPFGVSLSSPGAGAFVCVYMHVYKTYRHLHNLDDPHNAWSGGKTSCHSPVATVLDLQKPLCSCPI